MASNILYQPAQSAHGLAEFLVDKEAHFTNNGNIFVGSQTFQAENINIGPKKDADEDEYKCVRDLYSVDRDASILKEKQRDRLVEESFAWIFKNESFKLWLQDEQQERGMQEAPEIPSTMGSSSETAQPKTLLPNTRPQILCITAGPGMGKTMTMIGIINELLKTKGPVMSYYICQGTDDRLSSPAAAVKELLYQILSRPENIGLVKYLQEPYRKSGGKILEGDSENVFLVLQNVLMQLIRDDHLPEVYFFIDALDECKEPKYLLQMIKKTTFVSRKIHWLISHRNNLQVGVFLADLEEEDKVHSIIDFATHGPEVNEGIARYISGKVASLSHSRFNLDQKRRLSDLLLEKAQGTYLWINIACEALEEGSISGVDRLESIPPGLAALYDKTLRDLRANRFVHQDLLSSILGTMVVAFRPLVLAEFMAMLEHTSDNTGTIMRATKRGLDINTIRNYVQCNPFLMLQGDVISFIHHSAKEYLEQNSSVFQIIPPTESASEKWFHHRNMYINCRRQIIDIKLEKMIGVATNATLIDVSAIRQLDYACCHWANHLKEYVTMRWAPHNIPMAEASKEFQEEIL
ncbi:hypothetical protein TWF106_001982 [Orbilia oligospora]|nr:hypothetical protein TWF106_001982 [Orbilia oligospora]